LAAIPGLKSPDDIQIVLKDNKLKLSGQLVTPNKVCKGSKAHRQEIPLGSFNREINLPSTVYKNDIKTSYQQGILEIRLKKASIKKVRITD